MRLQESLNAIRGAALACEFTIPRPQTGTIDFRKVNVRFTLTVGREDLPYVGSANRCDPARGGWYYDVDPSASNPSRIKDCDASCTRFQSEQGARVDLLFGCATQTID